MPSSSFSVQQDVTNELDSFVKKEKLKSRTEGIKLLLQRHKDKS